MVLFPTHLSENPENGKNINNRDMVDPVRIDAASLQNPEGYMHSGTAAPSGCYFSFALTRALPLSLP